MKTIFPVLFLVLFHAFFDQTADAEIFRKNAVVMGTVLEVTIDAPSEAVAGVAFSSVEREMRRVEELMSEWREDSTISEVNRQSGVRPVTVPKELFNVISAALTVSEVSGGAFDITWASMRGLWDFRAGHERAPTHDEVKARLGLVGYREVVLDTEKSSVFLKRKGMAIGLGGIAKGYAVDKAMEAVLTSGIENAIIKAGGDIRVQGRQGTGKGWPMGIQDPRDSEKLLARLTLTNVSISTSGDYERFFVKDGIRYHHIIDPRTGWPARGIRSVTVIGPDTMTTDALSTAIFVLGPEKGLQLAEGLGRIEALIVDTGGQAHTTSGIDLKR